MGMIVAAIPSVAGSRIGIAARATFAIHARCINHHATTTMTIIIRGHVAAAMIIITVEDFTSHLGADDAKYYREQ
jgi:hypothetical protein